MDRRDFIKSTGAGALTLATTPLIFADGATNDEKDFPYPYFVNCYIQNQRYWPLEEYKGGSFGERSFKINQSACGEKWIDGKLRFYGFGKAVEFIDMHSRTVDLPKSLEQNFVGEIAYEVFHEKSDDPLIPPKHIFYYWAKADYTLEACSLRPCGLKEVRWVHPSYIDHEVDGALVEYV